MKLSVIVPVYNTAGEGKLEYCLEMCIRDRYQRLDYLLHIPVEQMVSGDPFYTAVKKYCRADMADTIKSPYLTRKQKVYLLLLSAAPKTVRRLHGVVMRLRKSNTPPQV